MTLAYAMEHAAALTGDAIERALRILRLGGTSIHSFWWKEGSDRHRHSPSKDWRANWPTSWVSEGFWSIAFPARWSQLHFPSPFML